MPVCVCQNVRVIGAVLAGTFGRGLGALAVHAGSSKKQSTTRQERCICRAESPESSLCIAYVITRRQSWVTSILPAFAVWECFGPTN